MSPSPPPLAAEGLFTANESKTNWANVELAKPEFLNKVLVVFSWLIVLELTLADVPPPVRYLTVKVVLLGAVP